MSAKNYMIFYNSFQFIGWTYLLLLSAKTFLIGGGSFLSLWPTTSAFLIFFQTLAVLEVFHCIVGFVKSSAFVTAIQVLSRLIVVWGILIAVPEVQSSIGFPLALIAWSIAELIRYSFYALNLLKNCPYILVWARYTFFIFLYPMGVSGELICMWHALPYITQKKLLTIELPNVLNATFSYHLFIIVVMLSYIPFFPQLYLYMISQRHKILNKDPAKLN